MLQAAGKERVRRWQSRKPAHPGRAFKTGEDGPGDFRTRDCFLAVSARLVARPKSDMLRAADHLGAEVHNGMSAFATADFGRPENLHEIARASTVPVDEVRPEARLREHARGGRDTLT